MTMTTKRIAVAIVGHNRPYYFLPSLRSILSNALISQCDLWVFIDGGKVTSRPCKCKSHVRSFNARSTSPSELNLYCDPPTSVVDAI